MDTLAYTDSTETMRASRIRCGQKAPVAAQTAIEKTPESELMTVRAKSASLQKKNRMSVEEYFGKLLKKLDKHYASVQES